jgi:hypothetical protein
VRVTEPDSNTWFESPASCLSGVMVVATFSPSNRLSCHPDVGERWYLLPVQLTIYRYVSWAEWYSIQETREVRSHSGVTYFAIAPPSRYVALADVIQYLAVVGKEMRFGPIPVDEAPDFDVLPPRTVGPQQLRNGSWVPGGGTEAATSGTLFLTTAVRLV